MSQVLECMYCMCSLAPFRCQFSKAKSFKSCMFCRVNERRESINVVIVKQSPAVRESKYSQAMVLDDPNRWTATHNEIEVELEAPKSPAQHMLPDFIYMNTRIKRRVGEKLHPPNASYMAPGSIPRLFFDAEGTYNGSFQDSVITGASRAWYSQPGKLQAGAGKLVLLNLLQSVCTAVDSGCMYITL